MNSMIVKLVCLCLLAIVSVTAQNAQKTDVPKENITASGALNKGGILGGDKVDHSQDMHVYIVQQALAYIST